MADPIWVHIFHPALPETNDAPPLVTKESFVEVWSKNGWKLHRSETNKEK